MVVFAAPIKVSSDVVEIQAAEDFTSLNFLRNASISGDDFLLTGDRIDILVSTVESEIIRAPCLSSIREIHAIDNAAFEQKFHSGKANKISIYPLEKILVLEGNAEISDAENGTVHGETLIFDSINKRVKIEQSEFGRSSIYIENFSKFKIPEKKYLEKKQSEDGTGD
jgi:lipopolysaccharide export system protein LptA